MVLSEIKKAIKETVTNSTRDNTVKCKEKPSECLRQIMLDGFVIIGLYSLLTNIVDGESPDLDKIVGFLALWTAIMFLLKSLDIEQSDQFSRVAFWTIASKVFGILTVGQ